MLQPAKRLEYVPDPNKFDLRTHVWDAQGHLVSKNLYRKYIIDGNSYYERPVNSGNLWFENNQPAGRVECVFNEKGHIASKIFDFNAAHKEFTPALQGSEKLHFELEQAREKNAALEAELASIHKEREEREALEAARKEVKNVAPAAAAPPVLKKKVE